MSATREVLTQRHAPHDALPRLLWRLERASNNASGEPNDRRRLAPIERHRPLPRSARLACQFASHPAFLSLGGALALARDLGAGLSSSALVEHWIVAGFVFAAAAAVHVMTADLCPEEEAFIRRASALRSPIASHLKAWLAHADTLSRRELALVRRYIRSLP